MQGMNTESVKVAKWKGKAKHYRQERDAYKKRIQELVMSRDHWKDKYQQAKASRLGLPASRVKGAKSADRIARHAYSSEVIMLSLWLRQARCSLNSCVEIMRLLVVYLGLELRVPSRSSIQHWEKKLGYWRIHQSTESPDDWVILLDESVSVGQQKLLVVLGVNLSHYVFGQALCLGQLHVLSVRVASSWKGAAIQQELLALQARGYQIAYAVSDGGPNLVKAFDLCQIERIADCSHALGKLLEKQYKHDTEFISFTKACSRFKRQSLLGEACLVMPPMQRAKGRFLNLQPLCQWGCQLLSVLEETPERLPATIADKLTWLITYRTMLFEMQAQCQTMNALFSLLKNQGLSPSVVQQCERVLEQSKVNDFFAQGVREYLQTNLKKVPAKGCRLCCSDSIESLFGKYKNQLHKTPGQVITQACLTIANLTIKPQVEEVRQALQETRMIDLDEWKKKNLPESLIQKRRKLFKSAG